MVENTKKLVVSAVQGRKHFFVKASNIIVRNCRCYVQERRSESD